MCQAENMGKLFCGFCGKTQDQVGLLIAGPITMICEGCVVDCLRILTDRSAELARLVRLKDR